LDGGGGGGGGGAGAFMTPNCAGGFGGGVGEGLGGVTFMDDNCAGAIIPAESPIAMPPPTPLAFDLDLALFLE
jgi:hypothetical protein